MVTVETLKQLALSFDGSVELPHFEKASFRVNKKIFATLDVNNKRACLMLSDIDQSVFCAFDNTIIYPVPNKWGKMGATFFELTSVPKNMLKDALAKAYQKAVKKNYH